MVSGLSRYTDFYHDDDLPATRLVIRPEVAASVRSGSATSDGLIDDELPSAFVVEPTPQQLTDYIDSNKSFSDKIKDAVYGATDVVKGLAQYTDYNLKNGINLEPLTSAVKSSYDDLFKSDDIPVKKNDDANHLIDLSGDNLVDRIVDYLNNKPFSLGSEAGNKLTGTVGRGNPTGERYQLWPERLVREALSPAGDAVAGKLPTYTIDPITGEAHTSPKMIEAAQAMSALAGTGGLGGVGAEAGTALGAGPFLRPALKYGEKLYKGKEGQQHLDLIPADLYPTFQKQAMNGDDISHWNFGFYNDKGHFLTRDKALQYGIDNGIIDPQSGKFGALTSTMMADSSQPAIGIQALKAAEKPFYSGVENALLNAKQSKADAAQWLGYLKNQPGVKQEELQHLGLDNLKGTLTKDELLKAVQEGQPQIKEVIKNTKDTKLEQYKVIRPDGNVDSTWTNAEAAAKQAEKIGGNVREAHETKPMDDTKYSKYQLPGGENYREMLLTLPPDKGPFGDAANIALNRYRQELLDKYGNGIQNKATPEELAKYADLDNRTTMKPNDYRSSHWDEPNVLVHIRMNDRTIDGKKSLHLEEIQSDWHQAGRKQGYKSEAATKEYDKLIEDKHELARNVVKIENELKAEIGKGYDIRNLSENDRQLLTDKLREAKANNSEYQKANKAYTEVADKVDKGNPYMGVPDAPFKKTWDELALKKALTEAVKNGYDQVSWTPGEAQAARYDLSKSVNRIEVPMINKDGSRSVRIDTKTGSPFKLMVDKNGIVEGHGASSSQFSGKPLSDVVGKEMADKLMNVEKNAKPYEPITELPKEFGFIHDARGAAKGEEWGIVTDSQSHARSATGRYHATKEEAKAEMLRQINSNEKLRHDEANRIFEGDGLKIGGEGMKAFYDKMLVDKFNALGKKYGAKVSKTEIGTGKIENVKNGLGRQAKEGKQPVYTFPITPKLREQIKTKGQPLFSAGLPIYTPVDFNPFEDKTK